MTRRRNPGGRSGVRSTRDPARDAAICALYPALTLDQIGTQFGLTRERIRQILRRNGVKAEPRTLRARAARVNGYTAYLEAAQGPTLAAAAERLGISESVLRLRLHLDERLDGVLAHLAQQATAGVSTPSDPTPDA